MWSDCINYFGRFRKAPNRCSNGVSLIEKFKGNVFANISTGTSK